MRFSTLLQMITAGTIAALTVPQDPPSQAPRTGAPQETAGKTTANRTDGILAGWLLVGTNNEVAVAQIALQRAQDPEVKQFAQKMVDDHRKLAQSLQPFASAATPGIGARPGENRPLEAGFGQEGELDHMALIQELGQQCLESTRKELEQKSGAEFDRCYMGMMVGGHIKANDTLTVFQRHASTPLKTVMADGQKTVAAHLQHAKDLSKKLEGKKEPAKTDDGR